jgi:hypothetical protein
MGCLCLTPPTPRPLKIPSNLYISLFYFLAIRICIVQCTFKGIVSRDFLLQVSFMNHLPRAPENNNRVISKFFENSRRYSQVKVHHRYQRHRWLRNIKNHVDIFLPAIFFWRIFYIYGKFFCRRGGMGLKVCYKSHA